MSKKLPSIINTISGVLKRADNADHVVTTVHKEFPSGVKLAVGVAVPKAARKADLIYALRDLKKAGFSQKDAAFLTGMSPSYASKLLSKKL